MDTSITLHRTPVVTSQYGPTNKHTVVLAYIGFRNYWDTQYTTAHASFPPLLNGIESI